MRPALLGLVVSLLLLSAPSAEEKRVSIYAPQVGFSLPVLDRENNEYVGLLEALEPLGTVTARLDGKTWKLRFRDLEAEFKQGKTGGKVRRNKVELPAPFLLEAARGLVPLHSLPSLLARFLDTRVDYHESARRLFVGNVATRFTAEFRKEALVVNFSSPVNPVISTEPGKLRMIFKREPLISGTETFKFEDPLIPSATFSESNGRAELTVTGTAPLMAVFSEGARIITITVAPGRAAQVPPPAPPAPVPTPTATTPQAPGAAATSPGGIPAPVLRQPYLVVVDPSHGGEERGAALTETLAEKDVTLALARRLRTELQARGINAMLVRDSDATLTTDQRAVLANTMRAAVFVTLHAGTLGYGVKIYTSMLAPSDRKSGDFLPWEVAQSGFINASHTLADEVASQLAKKELPVLLLAAPVRPLNNVTAAAIAVEVTPPGPKAEALNSATYQQAVASAVAEALASARTKLEGVP